MYLRGETFNWTDWEKPEGERRPMKDGFEVSAVTLEIGYWRKHPDLHGYIVAKFAEGKDECQQIDLTRDDLEQIIRSIQFKSLPKTSGFFFGESDGSEDERTIGIIKSAIQWLDNKEKNVSKSVYYRASW